MKKFLKRLIAYTIDIAIILLIVSLISNNSFINPQLKNYNKYYKDLIKLTENYNQFTTDLDKYYKKELTKENYQKLIEENPDYEDYISKYYEDNKLETKEYEKLTKEIEGSYKDTYKKLYYKIEKNSTISYVIYIIITILYFGLFNLITQGQTLGKKILKLKIVKSDNTEANILNYLLRSILLYNTIYYIVVLISIYTLNSNHYYTVANVVYEIQYYVQLIIIAMMLIRTDGKGLHDLLANTKVVSLDKAGNIINDEILCNENLSSKKVIEVEPEKKTEVNIKTSQTKKNKENKRKGAKNEK